MFGLYKKENRSCRFFRLLKLSNEKIIVFLLTLLSFNISCEKESLNKNDGLFSEDGSKMSDSMMAVMNDQLTVVQKTADSLLKNKTQKVDSTKRTTIVNEIHQQIQQNKKFVFVVLSVHEQTTHGLEIERFENKQLVSGIAELENYNDDTRARIEDDLIQQYKMSPWSGDIVSKQTFAFDSYSEASKKRNMYIIEE